jgi:hypothetical protein
MYPFIKSFGRISFRQLSQGLLASIDISKPELRLH